jgi:periplasmic divalent cation tolerance protein
MSEPPAAGDTCLLVLTTVGTKQFAADLAQSLIGARLAACVHISAVQSVFRWQGTVRSEPEWQLAIKTTQQRYAELEGHIRANHSYETPEIVRLEIAGSTDFMAWLRESV